MLSSSYFLPSDDIQLFLNIADEHHGGVETWLRNALAASEEFSAKCVFTFLFPLEMSTHLFCSLLSGQNMLLNVYLNHQNLPLRKVRYSKCGWEWGWEGREK